MTTKTLISNESNGNNIASTYDTSYGVFDGYVVTRVSERFLNKAACLTHARILILNGYITGMTEQQIAEEVFAHAVCYYWYDPNGNFFKSNALSKELYEKAADGIYIQNGGDTAVRKAFYTLVWNTYSGN